MPAGLKLVVAAPPSLSLQEAKDHLRVTWCEDDINISRLAAEATAAAQRECDRQFLPATWRLTLDDFPRPGAGGCFAAFPWAGGLPADDAVIRLPLPPLQSVTAVRYYATTGILTTIDPAAYFVDADGEPGRVAPAAGYWPPVQWNRPAAVQVEFVAGYAGYPATMPADLRGAVKLILADRWANRGDDGKADRPIPAGAARVLAAYRWHPL